MIRLVLIVTLALSATAFAQDVSGRGSAPLSSQKLTEDLTFAVISQEPDKTLHWKIIRNKHNAGGGEETMTAREAVLPGEEYAYYWDKEQRGLWFVTVRSLTELDLSDWASTSSKITSTSGFNAFEELPAAFRENMKKVLKR